MLETRWTIWSGWTTGISSTTPYCTNHVHFTSIWWTYQIWKFDFFFSIFVSYSD